MIKRPLLGWVVSLVLGMLCYQWKSVYVIVLGLILFLFLYFFRKGIRISWRFRLCKRTYSICLFTKEDWHRYVWPVFFILGFICMVQAKQVSPLESELASTMEGRMYGEVSDIRKKGDTITLLVEHIKVYQEAKDQWYEDDSKAVIYTKQDLEFSIGNQLLIRGTIFALSKATNPGQFDESSYYKAKGVSCKAFAEDIQITNHKTSFLANFIYRTRCQLTEQIQALLPKEEAGLMSAILFGDKTLLSEETKELYQKNGFAHIMAVSGLHISLLGYGLYVLLRKITAPVWFAAGVPVIVLIFYGALVGFTVSACRAILMFAILMLSVCIGRWYDMNSALSLAAIILLLKQPLQLYEPGFLLSFAAVIGIAVINPKLCEAFAKKGEKGLKIKKSLLISISTQLVTLPLTCYFFYEIAPYSILINLILLPLCSFLVLTSLIACLTSFLFIPLGRFLIGGSYYLLQFFSFILHIPERLPYHLILVGQLSILQMVGYYLILFATYFIYCYESRKWSWFGLIFLLLFFQVQLPNGIYLACLDVSQGDCFVLTSKEQVIMIDGGSSDVDHVYEYRIHPFLKSKGIRHINTIFISHADQDHVSGILECVEQITSNSLALKDYDGQTTIGRIVVPNLNVYDEAYQKIIQLAQKKNISVVTMESGQACQIGDITFRALFPQKGEAVENRNNTSLVLWAKSGEFDGLFLGDIDQTMEERVVENYYPEILGEHFEFLKVAHHGSRNSSSEKLLEVVKPELAVISVGKKNRYGHPHKETIKRLHLCGCRIQMTRESGAIELKKFP